MGLIHKALRASYRRESFPAPLRLWLTAAGMGDFYRTLARGLAGPLARVRATSATSAPAKAERETSRAAAQRLLARLSVRMFARRYALLRASCPALPDLEAEPRALGVAMSRLYLAGLVPPNDWIFAAAGGPSRGLAERLRAERWLWPLDAEARWRELTVHLGELLIVLTEDLPAELPHARRVLGDICFASGQRYAQKMRRLLALPAHASGSAPDPAALAIEVLRTSEYLFRVNPEHWGATDAATRSGHLEGTACPWYDRPGWEAGHCGIFGQFQAGVCSEFGLRYNLSTTIPKHGGSTCRVDLKPLPLERLRRPKPSLVG